MREPQSSSDTRTARLAPAWASCLGVVAIVLGVLLTATHANEWMKQDVLARFTPETKVLPAARCPADELEEEELSLAECEYMVSRLEGLIQATPEWFAKTQTALASIGTLVAFASIIMGAALVNFREWAPRAAAITFGLLMAIDVLGFIAALNTGPVTREIYLWNAVLWATLHMLMLVGAANGWRYEASRAMGGGTVERAPQHVDARSA
jgi:hypothetical protein